MAISGATTHWNHARRPNPIARVQEMIPACKQSIRSQSGTVEQVSIEGNPKAVSMEAGPILLALENAQLRRAGSLQDIPGDETIEGKNMALPHILHVVDPVPEVLHIGWMLRDRRFDEAIDDV